MLFLSGAWPQTLLASERRDVGLMVSPGMGNDPRPFQFRPWAADNGCFSQGATFDAGDWLEWLAGLRRHRARCLFAVAPDVVGDAAATRDRALPYLPTVRHLGYPVAYVAQNGVAQTPPPWGQFDYLFLGGDDPFKVSGECDAVVLEARLRGVPVHMGRVNTLIRLRDAARMGCATADGTFLAYGPDVNWPKLCSYLDRVNGQPALEAVA